MIQKVDTNIDTTEGEVDNPSIVLSDRTANLDITNESASNVEGSGADEVEPEGVSSLHLLFDIRPSTIIIG